MVFILASAASAAEPAGNNHTNNYTNEQIVNAIFKAEGGYKAKYLYGIRSVQYKDEADARRICLNTVRNNRTRFIKQTKHKNYLEFLASRYCPTKGNLSNAEQKLNHNWLNNVRYFLQKGAK